MLEGYQRRDPRVEGFDLPPGLTFDDDVRGTEETDSVTRRPLKRFDLGASEEVYIYADDRIRVHVYHGNGEALVAFALLFMTSATMYGDGEGYDRLCDAPKHSIGRRFEDVNAALDFALYWVNVFTRPDMPMPTQDGRGPCGSFDCERCCGHSYLWGGEECPECDGSGDNGEEPDCTHPQNERDAGIRFGVGHHGTI